jgi:hypothetical protein
MICAVERRVMPEIAKEQMKNATATIEMIEAI